MPYTEYAYALGFNADAGDFINYETTFTEPYLWAQLRVPLGSVTDRALSGRERTDGWRKIILEQVGDPYGFTLFEDLDAYVNQVFGGWESAENADLTLRSDDLSGGFTYWNVIAHLPKIGQDYTHIDTRYVRDLKLRHTVISAATVAEEDP